MLGVGVEHLLVASSGSGRLVLELPAAAVGWLSNEAPAGRGPVAAWLERGEQETFIRSARRDVQTTREEAFTMVLIGVDPHKATHTAVATQPGDRGRQRMALAAVTHAPTNAAATSTRTPMLLPSP